MAAKDPVELAQEVLREGPVVLVGSGVSLGVNAAFGLSGKERFPGMGELGERLLGTASAPPEDPGLHHAWEEARQTYSTSVKPDFEKALDQVRDGQTALRQWAAGRIAGEIRRPDDAAHAHLMERLGKDTPEDLRRSFGLAHLVFRLVNGLSGRWPVLTIVTTN